jgi:hypothetical protein
MPPAIGVTQNLYHGIFSTVTPGEMLSRLLVQAGAPADVYADPINFGARAHMPPVNALLPWVKLKFGVEDEKSALRIAWAVAIKQRRTGMRGRYMFDRAVQVIDPEAPSIIEHYMRVAIDAAGHGGDVPLLDIITAVTARLTAVTSAKNVYSYVREAKEQAVFAALFKDTVAGNIHTWMVTRQATVTKDEGVGTYRRIHEIAMMGFMSMNDAANSEGTFQSIIEDVCAAFDPLALRQYGGAYDWSQPVQVEGPTLLMYSQYLCHAVKLIHRVEELCYE